MALALTEPGLTSTLAALRSCWGALGRAELSESLFGAGCSIGREQRGATTMLATLDGLSTRGPAAAALARVACAVYGLWVFEGLRLWIDPVCDWSAFEADMLGSIKKTDKSRKSIVAHCAKHPIQMLDSYGYL